MPTLRAKTPPKSTSKPSNPSGKPMTMMAKMAPSIRTPVFGQGLQLVLQQCEGQCADDRSEEIGEAAKHRHENELAGLGPIDQLGIGEANAKAKNGPAGGAKRGGNDKRGQPKTMHVHAEIFRLARIVADGLADEGRKANARSATSQDRRSPACQAIIVERTGEKLDLVVCARMQAREYSCAARACRCRRR